MPRDLVPNKYRWLLDEPGPRLLTEFLRIFGTEEDQTDRSNPTILQWARSINYDKIYRDDAIPWCGLAMAYVAGQAGWDFAPRGNPLWALNWASWGDPTPTPMLADVLVFNRKGGGHVGVYVAEDDTAFHVLGGNQDDAVNVRRVDKGRFVAARRCPWRINQPANIRRIRQVGNEPVSLNEA
jgi:uncharacterized protein (TIGR02594 family)